GFSRDWSSDVCSSDLEIFFTSGGTEADNTALFCGIESHDIQHAITTPLEHHAVLHPLEACEKKGQIRLNFVEVDEKGRINLAHLDRKSVVEGKGVDQS